MTASANALRESLSSGMKLEVAALAQVASRDAIAGRGRNHTSGGHTGGRQREHRQPHVLLAAVQRPAAPRSGTPPRMSRAWETAGHGVPTGRSVSRVLLFLTGDRTFTSRVLNPAPVHGDRRWMTSVATVE